MDPDDLIEVVKIEPAGLGYPMICRLDSPEWKASFADQVSTMIEGMEPGESITLTTDRMRVGDYELLGEHQGW